MKITLVRHGKTQSNQNTDISVGPTSFCAGGDCIAPEKNAEGDCILNLQTGWCAAPCGAASRRRHGSARRAILIG